MRLITRPIDVWPDRLRTDSQREAAPFTAGWSDTLELLERELRFLGADHAVLELAITGRDCRLDGGIRADARPAHPGAILAFESSDRDAGRGRRLRHRRGRRRLLRDVLYRDAAKRLHPDAGGDAELFKRLTEAKRLLDERLP